MTPMPDMMTAGLKMILALGVVLAVMLALLFSIRKMSRRHLAGTTGKRVQVLENHYLGVKKTISLVRVPGKILVLGVTGDRISLLDTLAEPLTDATGTPLSDAPGEEGERPGFGPLLADRLKKIGGTIKETALG